MELRPDSYLGERVTINSASSQQLREEGNHCEVSAVFLISLCQYARTWIVQRRAYSLSLLLGLIGAAAQLLCYSKVKKEKIIIVIKKLKNTKTNNNKKNPKTKKKTPNQFQCICTLNEN